MAKHDGITKRLGARYGTTIKQRLGKVEAEQKRGQKCPYCSSQKVVKIAIGIWGCERCKAKFSGRAYKVNAVNRYDIKAKGV